MKGTSATTGKALTGLAHLKQSITDILTTRIGTRIQRQDYGSRLFELIDAPINRSTLLDYYAATAEALSKWEPRFSLESVVTESTTAGSIVLTLTGVYLPSGEKVTLDGIKVS